MGKTDRSEQQLLEELDGLRARVAALEGGAVAAAAPGLHDSRLRYKVLYEENPSMYFTVDSDGIVLAVNPFGAEQLGYSVDDLLGQPVLGVFHDEDKAAVREQLRRCIDAPGEAFNWEFRKVRKDGTVMWVREVARAVRYEAGQTVVLIVCEDISERKWVEQQLRESRERYRTLFTKAPAMLHSIDVNEQIVDVSDYWLDVMGYTRHEVLGRRPKDFLTSASREYAEESAMPRFFRTGRIHEVPYQFVKKSGEVMDTLLSAIAEHDEAGNFVRSLAVIVDVTVQKRAEEALRQARDEMEQRVKARTAELERQRRFLRQVIDVDPNLIFAKDREGRFTLVNQAVANVYGTTVEELIGKTDADFNLNKEEVEYFRRMDLEVMDTLEERFIPEERITDAGGAVRWLQTFKRPLVDDSGTADQLLGSATDITTRKETEQKLRESEAALRRSHAELRTLAGRLLTAQEDERRHLAREIHDDVSQRLAGLVMQTARLGQLGPFAGEVAELVTDLRRDLRQLASDVHALSHRLHPSILEDLGLIDALASECAAFSQREGIEVAFASSADTEAVPKETTLSLYRIAQEALRNVAKHASTDRARVTLERNEDDLTLTIADRGAGFDPGQTGGSKGLGLASMQERARLIEAEFSIQSQPGRGTTIHIRVPLNV